MRDPKTHIEEVLTEADRLMRPLSDVQVNWQPAAGTWSVGECVDHLSITTRRFRDSIEEALIDSRRRNWSYADPAKPSPFGLLFLRVVEPPVGFGKVKAPRDLLPQPNRPSREILSEFQTVHQGVLTHLPEYLKWDQNRTRVKSAFPVKFSLGLMLRVIPAHCRRHLWQAEQVAKMPGFPKA